MVGRHGIAAQLRAFASIGLCMTCHAAPTQPLVRKNPQLSDIRLAANTIGVAGGGVRILGVLSLGTPTLGSNDAVPIKVRVTNDSTIEVLLTAALCDEAGRALHSCRVFGVGINAGHSILDLAPKLPAIGGIFIYVAIDGSSGSVAFSSESLASVISRVRRWPEVRFVEPDDVYQLTAVSPLGSGVAGILPSCDSDMRWRIPCMGFTDRPTLDIEYNQPDGSTLRRIIRLEQGT